MIRNLQSLRGVAAILIFYHHYGFQSYIFTSFGDFGVTFFMMLSGFVLYYATAHKCEVGVVLPRISTFMLNRLSKIYPLYILCWIAAVIVLPYSGAFVGKILGLFAIQSWIPKSEVYFAGNGVSWFISDLVLCYVLFIPVFKIMQTKSKLAYSLISGYFFLYICTILLIPENLVHPIIYINPLMQFANFLLGMMLCHLFISRPKIVRIQYFTILQFAALALIIICMVLYSEVSTRFSYSSYWWLPVMFCIYIFATSDASSKSLNKILHYKFSLLIGKLSFSLYLIHGIGINCWQRFLNMVHWQTNDCLLMFVQSICLLLILLVISNIIERYFVEPMAQKIKNLCR